MTITELTPEQIPECLAIYNYYIKKTCYTLEEQPRELSAFTKQTHRIQDSYPFLTARDEDGVVLGYVYLDCFNERSAYRCSADLTIYVRQDQIHTRIGSALYAEIEQKARLSGIQNIISLITSSNEGSVHFHEKQGFTQVGRLKDVAFKFGHYVDVSFYQKQLTSETAV